MTVRTLIASGAGRYADPWHPFAETSARLATILGDAGFDVEVDENVDARLADLTDVDLLVTNVGAPGAKDERGAVTGPSADPAADDRTRAGLLAHLAAGKPLLALHVSATGFGFIPEWESVLGGIWVRGTTMHPDFGFGRIHVYPDRHEIVRGLHDFDVNDERYSYLRVADDVQPLASHEHDGVVHPILWSRVYGSARIVYHALGHDARSYDAPEQRRIIASAARWLTATGH